MKKLFLIAGVATMLLASCNSEPTMQKYFVEKSEQKNFSAVDIGTSFIKTDSLKLDKEQKAALESIEHVNILLFKKDSLDATEYNKQTAEVKNLLATDKYEQLAKFNFGEMGASINTKGEGEHIEEFVVYVKNSESGFGLIRVTGDDMTPNNVFTVVQLLQNAGIDGKQLEPLKQLLSNKK